MMLIVLIDGGVLFDDANHAACAGSFYYTVHPDHAEHARHSEYADYAAHADQY